MQSLLLWLNSASIWATLIRWWKEQLKGLSSERLEELGEALFDFNSPADLGTWLQAHR